MAYDGFIARHETDHAYSNAVDDAMFAKVLLLGESEQTEDALSAVDELLARCDDASDPDPGRRGLVAAALGVRALRLLSADRGEDAAAALEELLTRFESEVDVRTRELIADVVLTVARALRGWPRRPSRAGQIALHGLAALTSRFRAARRSAVAARSGALQRVAGERLGVVGDLVRRRVTLVGDADAYVRGHEQALRVCDAVIDRFGGDPSLAAARLLARAQLDRASTMAELGRIRQGVLSLTRATSAGEPAAAGFASLAKRAERSASSDARATQAASLFGRMATMDDPATMIAALDDFIRRFHQEENLRLRMVVWFARGLRLAVKVQRSVRVGR